MRSFLLRAFRRRQGQRLVERELVDRLQVSRATIRESLRELEAEGLVTVIPQRGAVVASISLREAADIYEARAAIESLIVRRFVERAGQEYLVRLARSLDELGQAIDAGRPVRELLAVKDRFYDVLIDGADSVDAAFMSYQLHDAAPMQYGSGTGVVGGRDHGSRGFSGNTGASGVAGSARAGGNLWRGRGFGTEILWPTGGETCGGLSDDLIVGPQAGFRRRGAAVSGESAGLRVVQVQHGGRVTQKSAADPGGEGGLASE
jgi:hypothetical protein